MNTHDHSKPTSHFGPERAAVYDAQAPVNLAGCHGMYEVIAAALASELADQASASLLLVGVGTGTEVLPIAKYGAPGWRFTGIDPSADMLAVAQKKMATEGLGERTRLHVGELATLPPGPLFDGGSMIGVLHHVQGDEARLALMREVGRRLKPGAPFVLGCRVGADPRITRMEMQRFLHNGMPPEMLEKWRTMAPLMQPPASEASLFALLKQAAFVSPHLLFASFQFKVFVTRFDPAAKE